MQEEGLEGDFGTRAIDGARDLKPRLLVTGGCGFIGSALVRRVLAGGCDSVVNVDCLTYAACGEVPSCDQPDHYSLEQVNVTDFASLTRILEAHRPRAIVHLAAESHVDRAIDSPAPFVETNIVGTSALLEAATRYWCSLPDAEKKRFRFLHVSTDEVYGSADDGKGFTENNPYRPNSPYAASKAAADHLVRAWWRTYGLPAMISNCGNNYGPYQFPEKLIPLSIIRAVQGKSIRVYGDGRQVRDWIHVDDHVSGLLAVLERGRPGEAYNIGAGDRRENLEVVHAICEALDEMAPLEYDKRYRDQITYVEDRPGHDRIYALETAKARQELAWGSTMEFSIGLRDTVSWYLNQKPWWNEILDRRYDGGRIGLPAGPSTAAV